MTSSPSAAGSSRLVSATALHAAAGPPPDPPRLQALPSALPSDTELISRSVGGPGAVRRRCSTGTRPTVHRYLGRRVGDLADDLLSETFLDRLPAAGGLPPRARRGAALAAGHRHEPGARPRPGRAAPVPGARPGGGRARRTGRRPGRTRTDRLAAQALRGPLAAALAGLKPRDRDVLLLFAWEQLSYEEIAAVLDVPVGTVRSRLNRARRQTRAALAPSPSRRTDERHHAPARGRPRGPAADDRRPACRPRRAAGGDRAARPPGGRPAARPEGRTADRRRPHGRRGRLGAPPSVIAAPDELGPPPGQRHGWSTS